MDISEQEFERHLEETFRRMDPRSRDAATRPAAQARARVAARGREPARRAGFDGLVDSFVARGMTATAARTAAIGRDHVSESAARAFWDAPTAATGGAEMHLDAIQTRLHELEELLANLPPDDELVTESSTRRQVVLAEACVIEASGAGPGRLLVQLVKAGFSGNGRYYSETVLKRDAKIFGAGLKMYADHDTDLEDATRPGGSVGRLAGVLAEAAYYDPARKALMAKVRLFAPWREAISDMAEHIGVSIRVMAEGDQGTAEGRSGWIVSRLVEARSVDFVTTPAAGGRIVGVAEGLAEWVDGLDSSEVGQDYVDAAEDMLITARGLLAA